MKERLALIHGSVRGHAIYFASNPKYSDKYSHLADKNIRELLLVAVMTGYSYHSPPDSTLIMPPFRMDTQPVLRYDSITGTSNHCTITMIDKTYPAFLIRYMCKNQ